PLISSWAAPELLPNLAKALSRLTPNVLAEISDITLTPTVYDKQRVTLYMRDGNEVRSVVYKLDKMLNWYPAIVAELPAGTKGVLSMFEQPWFVPYGAGSDAIPIAGSQEQTEKPQ
ncbi:cell division protein DivIB, partial [Mesorhizobium sp. M00.F.Ca.ET.186.01.1.1]